MNNSCYGKTMEDIRKHTDIKLISNPMSLEKRFSNPLFRNVHTINDNLVCVEMGKQKVVLKTTNIFRNGYIRLQQTTHVRFLL